MTRPLSIRLVAIRARLVALRAEAAHTARLAWRALRRRRVPVEVLVADPRRRRALEREVRCGLRRLERVLGAPLPMEAAVLVQQVIPGERPFAGCYQTGLRQDGRRYARIRLALEVDGRALATDELLAVLAEQCLGLADQTGRPSVLVPIELRQTQPAKMERPRVLRPDPLTSHVAQPNGQVAMAGHAV